MIDDLSRFNQFGAHLNTNARVSFVGTFFHRHVGGEYATSYEWHFTAIIDGASVTFFDRNPSGINKPGKLKELHEYFIALMQS